MKILRLALASLISLTCFGSCAAWAAGRAEVPITQTVLSNGDIRYSIPVSIGGSRRIAAMLDTGSTGLRVLSGTIPDSSFASITDTPSLYHYNSGIRLNGVIAKLRLRISGVPAAHPFKVQLVRSVDCVPDRPHCPASRISPEDYRIGGDGLPKEGFFLILGVSMGSADADNPLRKIGAQSWIIELPAPGASSAGRLIINPNEEDIAGYKLFPTQRVLHHFEDGAALHDAIPGCLNFQRIGKRVCGPTFLDSGAPGVHITTRDPASLDGRQAGDLIGLGFTDQQGGWLKAQFSAGAARPSRISVSGGPDKAPTRILSGTLPYFFFSALYDDQQKMVGLKRR